MRLIDADEAIKYLENHKKVRLQHNIGLEANEDNIIKFINDKCHTVEAEPMRHGRWVMRPQNGIEPREIIDCCSYCGYPISHFYRHKYCPECGAKMDLESKEAEFLCQKDG